MKKFDIAVVGCTGKVGRQMITVLEERKLPYNNVIMFASAKSAGMMIPFLTSINGIVCLAGASVMVLIGWIIIRKIVTIKV